MAGKVIDLSQPRSSTTIGFNFVEQNYNDLSAISGTIAGELGYVVDSQGTAWLPGTIGGNYYPAGIYVWDGANWVSDRNAIATQLNIDTDDISQLQTDLATEITNRTNADISLQNQINNKLDSVIGGTDITIDNTDPLNPIINSTAVVITNHSGLILDDGTNPHGTTKADVGLGNVDNTSDADKPISTATQTALDTKVESVVAGTDISVDNTDAKNPIVNYDGLTTPSIKSGLVLAAAFSGNPKKTAAITFTTPFASANYSIVLTAHTQNNTTFSIDYESRLAGSFIINSHANNISNLIDVTWIATEIGEN